LREPVLRVLVEPGREAIGSRYRFRYEIEGLL
jgi:hypothetical protein